MDRESRRFKFPSSLWGHRERTTRPKEKRLSLRRARREDAETTKLPEASSRAKGVRERGTFSTSGKRRMCFGENSTFFVFLNPGVLCETTTREREREREREIRRERGPNKYISLSHGNWNEEDTDARRDKKKSERFDVWAWREYHVRVLKGKLF